MTYSRLTAPASTSAPLAAGDSLGRSRRYRGGAGSWTGSSSSPRSNTSIHCLWVACWSQAPVAHKVQSTKPMCCLAVCRVTVLLHTGRVMQVSMTESEAAGAALKALGVKQLLPPPSLGKAAAGTGTGRPRSAVSSVEKLQELVPKVCCRMLPPNECPAQAAAEC